MFEPGKKLFRRFFPRLRDPLLDAPFDRARFDDTYQSAYLAEPETAADDFSRERYAEGCRWRSVLQKLGALDGITLDLGAGNGAVELSFRAAEKQIVSVEREWNDTVRRVHARTGIAPHRVVADATALHFRADTFANVLFLETLEHVERPSDVAMEIGRVMKTDGIVLITTPPRWRYVAQRDPHFAIPFLVALPVALQRRIAAKRGYDQPHHYVNRIYSSTHQIAKLFRGFALDRVLSRSRSPRRWFWDAIALRKRLGTVHSKSHVQ